MRKMMWIAAAVFIASIVASNAAEFKRVTEPGYDLSYVCRGQDIFTIAGRQVQRQVCGWRHQALDMPPGVYGSYWLGPLPQGPTNGPFCPPGFDCSYDIGAPRTRVIVGPQSGSSASLEEFDQQVKEAMRNYKWPDQTPAPTPAESKQIYDRLWKGFKEANP